MSLSTSDKNSLVQLNVDKAEKTIEEVKFLKENNYFSLALNRVYYGMFYIISALAIKNDFSTSNYSQMIGWFNKEFVKGNKVDRKIGRIIYTAFEQRMKSDYDILQIFTSEDVEIGLENLIEVINAIKALINTL